jgi:hypothetical protein
MITTPDFRAELERLVELYEELGGNWSPHGYTDIWNDALANARIALATPPPEPPTDEEIEEAAKLIHASMRFAAPDNHYTRDWVERGNSLMQDEARRTARAVLERWGHA